METSIQEKRQRLVFWTSFVCALISFVLLFILITSEMIVRWKINQEFSFLSGFGLESLMLLTLGLFAMLMYTNRQK